MDLLLSSVGIAPVAVPTTQNKLTTQDGISIYGLCGMVMIQYTNILIRTSTAAVNTTKGARSWVDTPYTDAKLMSVTITVTPNGIRQSRSGRWGLLFLPFRDAQDMVTIQNDYRPLTLAQLQQMAGSVSGPADRPLQLNFTPKPEDGLSYQFNPMNTYFGAIVIAYSEDMRKSYHDFTADDFSPDVTVRGTLKLRQPHFGSPVVGYQDSTWSPNYPMAVYCQGKNKTLTFTGNSSYVCSHSDNYPGQCKAVGVEKPLKLPHSLDEMALE